MIKSSLKAAAIVAILMGIISGAVRAEQPCDQLIVDSQGYIKDVSSVTEAANTLGQQGAEVRIRVIDNFSGSSNLDVYVEKMWKGSCQSWQQSNGDLRSNFIVMYVATGQRGVGLYMGSQWERELKRAWPRIMEAMKPKLRGGLENHDLSLAFITGLRAFDRTIEEANQPPQQQLSNPVVIQTEPTDFSGLWNVLLILIACGFISGLGYLAYWVISEHRKQERERREIHKKAQIERGRCTDLINELRDALPLVEARTRKVGESFDEATFSNWKRRAAEISSAVRLRSEANASIRGNPDDEGLAIGESKALHDAYVDLKKELEKIMRDMRAFTDELKEAEQLQQGVSDILVQSRTAIAEAKAAVATVEQEGYLVVDISSELATQVESLLVEAEQLMAAKRLRDVAERCQEVVSRAQVVAEAAQKLPETKREIEEQIRREKERSAVVQQEIESGYQVFIELESSFSPVCIESIVGNGTEAQKHLGAAQENIAIAQVSWKDQAWHQAGEFLDEAKANLDEASSLMRSITERKRHLHIARDEAPGEIEAARADIARGREYLNRYDADTDDAHFSTLDKAEALVNEAESLLQESQPDYLRVVRLVTSANKTADVVLEKAEDEHELAERKRREAHALLREAASSVSAAKEFIEDHKSDVGSKAKDLLKKAVSGLASAEQYHQVGDVDAVIKVAGEADRDADSALEKAKRNFRDAEEEREEEERQRRARRRRASESSSYSGSSSSSWGSSSGSFGGGGSSFGGSSSFGGGGSSFGGSSSF